MLVNPTKSALSVLLAVTALQAGAQSKEIAWPAYGGDGGGTRFSRAALIDTSNVGGLTVAWTYHTGEAGAKTARPAKFETTPIVVDGTMYVSTPFGRVIALDPTSGAERWSFDARVPHDLNLGDFATRGVSTWLDPTPARGVACARTIYVATADARLIAIDARDGKPCARFGNAGTIDLTRGLRNPSRESGDYAETSPPAIVNGMVVVGSSVGDNGAVDKPSGEVRAFDARTGALRWSFDPVVQDQRDPNWNTWRGPNAHTTGAGNVWSVIAVDSARDLVILPTTSPSPDYYGGSRIGDDHYASSVVALHARTGKIAWHFQTVHHDLWDYDNASPPALVTIRKNGKPRDVVIQATKSGQLFILDRDTGKPVFPVAERPVPQSDVPGDTASPTQPFNTALPPISPLGVSDSDIWNATDTALAECREMVKGLRSEGAFTPPALRGTVQRPSNVGGAAWGGVAYDRATNTVFVPVNRFAAMVQLIDTADYRRNPQVRSANNSHLGYEYTRMHGTPYIMRRRLLLASNMIPCTKPPFGTLTAIDLNRAAVAWDVPIGTWPPGPAGNRWGSVVLGGPIITAGGLIFQSGTIDRQLYAYDVHTGRELWKGALPAGGRATPMTYVGRDGRQYVVISAGGNEEFGEGDSIVAFALPAK